MKQKNIFILFNLIILFFSFIKSFYKEQSFFGLYLFTKQVVFLINLSFILTFFKNKKIIKYLNFIFLIDCILLFFYNFVIENSSLYIARTNFDILVSILEHLILPILYIYYYFFIDRTTIKYRYFYIFFIHPIVYVIGILIFDNSPYLFLEPKKMYSDVFLYFLFMILFILIFSLFSLLLIYIKKKLKIIFLK